MWLRLGTASLVAVASAQAQSARVIDDATFAVTRAGVPFGTEAFKIIRRPGSGGVEYATQSTRTIEGRIIRAALSTDSAGTMLSYMRSATGAVPGQLSARVALNRLTVNEEGPQASSRDYPFSSGSVILDDDVIHTLFFVTWMDPREMGFVDLSAKTAGRGSLVEIGREDLVIGGTTIPAVRLEFGTGDAKREIWIDSGKRLLKVAHPARQMVGTRDLPPR